MRCFLVQALVRSVIEHVFDLFALLCGNCCKIYLLWQESSAENDDMFQRAFFNRYPFIKQAIKRPLGRGRVLMIIGGAVL